MSELPKLTFVLGGASSGKSTFAERLVIATGAAKTYVATSQVFDEEMAEKVRLHLATRGGGWTTIEEPLDMSKALSHLDKEQVVLLDCASMWLTNHMMAEHDLEAETAAFVAALRSCKARVVVVSNEVGMGIVPDNALARRFRIAQGKLNQELAAISDLAVFVLAGLPQVLKGQLP
jgi:adenosylcobinamide kinase/adenosylcobinamide-phosphate guanylyltransferase